MGEEAQRYLNLSDLACWTWLFLLFASIFVGWKTFALACVVIVFNLYYWGCFLDAIKNNK